MANWTDPHAVTSHLILAKHFPRLEIFQSNKWKKECISLDVESVKSKANDLISIGGLSFGAFTPNTPEPSRFLCLLTRCVQGHFDKKDVEEFVRDDKSTYLRALGAFYMRLFDNRPSRNTWYLKLLFEDKRQIYITNKTGTTSMMKMSTFAEQLLTARTLCDVTLPQIQQVEEQTNPSVSFESGMRAGQHQQDSNSGTHSEVGYRRQTNRYSPYKRDDRERPRDRHFEANGRSLSDTRRERDDGLDDSQRDDQTHLPPLDGERPSGSPSDYIGSPVNTVDDSQFGEEFFSTEFLDE